MMLLPVLASWLLLGQLPLEPARDSGQSVTAAYEGWFKNPDGTYSLLVGYFNRNHKEAPEIPIGPNNYIEPGGPDRGQPTYFLPRRQWGVFTINVPADFPGRKLTWTLIAHDKKTEVPMGLDPRWEVEPFKDAAQGNTPPVLQFETEGPAQQGPPLAIHRTFDAVASEPKTLTVWATDDAIVDPDRLDRKGPPVTVKWSKFRGPGEVAFSNPNPDVDPADGKAATDATFAAPGEYILRVQANDVSGEGGAGFQCCWTNAHVKVVVQPAR
ncbi:MAG: hypothetical protein ACRD21_11340 [Vicinamibacteria bacterium]